MDEVYNGKDAGKNLHPYFVPPVYDLLQPEGFFKIEEEQISAINIRIRELENSSSYLGRNFLNRLLENSI